MAVIAGSMASIEKAMIAKSIAVNAMNSNSDKRRWLDTVAILDVGPVRYEIA